MVSDLNCFLFHPKPISNLCSLFKQFSRSDYCCLVGVEKKRCYSAYLSDTFAAHSLIPGLGEVVVERDHVSDDRLLIRVLNIHILRIQQLLDAQLLLCFFECLSQTLVHLLLLPRVFTRVSDVVSVFVEEGAECQTISPTGGEVSDTHTRVPRTVNKFSAAVMFDISFEQKFPELSQTTAPFSCLVTLKT